MEFERGFHGWLVLFFASSCLGACLRAYVLFRTSAELRLATESHSFPLLLTVVALLLIRGSLFVATIVGLHMFAKGDSRTPTFWAMLLIASSTANAVSLALGAYEASLLNGDGFAATLWSQLGPWELWSSTGPLVWVFYWMRSTRVRLTFGRNAFSASRSAPIEFPAPVT
jgi:hypothetical protein